MIKFTIDGRKVDPANMKDALKAAFLERVRTHLAEKIGSIRDPETGEFPTVVVRGDDLDNLKIHVEGSPPLVALVNERLASDTAANETTPSPQPRAFLSYASEDIQLAERIAKALEASGIKTWWDKWCIYPGDSLRMKIDEGIADCTHFLVLLTPRSVTKPWVNQEMDGAFVRKLSNQCKFLPLRSELSPSALPPTLAGMHSPAIGSDEEIAQLVRDIYEISRRPPQGTPPAPVAEAAVTKTGYSPAATAVAKLFVERSHHALWGDPQFTVDQIAAEAGLSKDDTEDALHELSGFYKRSLDHVFAEGALFAKFDSFWKAWNPAEDAVRLAADLVNDAAFPDSPQEIAMRYGWEPRRLNAAIYYLFERRLLRDYQGSGTAPFAMFCIEQTDSTRRFVKSRS